MAPSIIDCHVHLLGNGLNGSGCRIALHGTARIFSKYMCSSFGIPSSALQGDLESLYVERLAGYLRDSTIDKLVVLASDHVRNDRGEILEKFDRLVVPNDFVLDTCRKHPDFIPAVSIHPARPDALDELARCHALGARVMKCLPNYHNIDCNNPKYAPFWNKMAELRIVLLAHTGGELSLPNVGPEFRNPRTLVLPLQCGVTVIAAHCGTRGLPFESDYRNDFLAMLEQFPNLYGDNSALTAPNRALAGAALAKSSMAGRILHGSDLPIPVSPTWLSLFGKINRTEARRIRDLQNPLERDYAIKRALGYPEESFRTLGGLLGL